MAETVISSIYTALSRRRLRDYKLSSDNELDVFCRYLWNIDLNKSLYPSLHMYEVCLRNHLYTEIAALTENNKWLSDELGGFLYPKERQLIEQAKKSLENKGNTLSISNIVSELSLGFWTSLSTRHLD